MRCGDNKSAKEKLKPSLFNGFWVLVVAASLGIRNWELGELS